MENSRQKILQYHLLDFSDICVPWSNGSVLTCTQILERENISLAFSDDADTIAYHPSGRRCRRKPKQFNLTSCWNIKSLFFESLLWTIFLRMYLCVHAFSASIHVLCMCILVSFSSSSFCLYLKVFSPLPRDMCMLCICMCVCMCMCVCLLYALNLENV